MTLRTAFLMLGLAMLTCGFQAKKVDHLDVAGVVEKVDKDFNFIVVNDTKMLLTPKTIILNEKGEHIKPEGLKEKSKLLIETLSTPKGYVIRKITVDSAKGP